MKAIEINNLCKKYKDKMVLDNLSLSFECGNAYGLVGLNGIGKTTTIKIMVGLATQDSGKVTILGSNNLNLKLKNKIAYLPEKFAPSHFLTGEEFLNISLKFHGKEFKLEDAATICEELDFDPQVLTKQIGKYSKGMGQKLGLIATFMSDATLLILDEPMSGLDPRARIYLKKKLLNYKKAGHSIFFSSHILADVEEICDSIGIIHDGKLQYQGNVEAFIKKNKARNLEEAYLKTIQ